MHASVLAVNCNRHFDSYSHSQVADGLLIFLSCMLWWNKSCRAAIGILSNDQSVSLISTSNLSKAHITHYSSVPATLAISVGLQQ